MGQKEKQLIDKIFNFERGKQSENTEAENVSLIIEEWLKPKHVKFKTRYNSNQIIAISILQNLADTYNIKTLKRFLKNYRIAKLSEGGETSKELRDILMSRVPKQEDNNLSKLSKFLD
jgi:hypothetical protein